MTKIPTTTATIITSFVSRSAKTILSSRQNVRSYHTAKNVRPWFILPISLMIILVVVSSIVQYQQIALLVFLPNTEGSSGTTGSSTCWIQLLTTHQQQQQQQILRPDHRIVTYDEFFYYGPSLEITHQFFNYNFELYTNRFYGNNSEFNFHFHPLWENKNMLLSNSTNNNNYHHYHHPHHSTSTTDPKKNKLIFLHTSRTAGITIRAILRAYAVKQNRTVLTVQQCSDLNHEFMESTDSWRNGRYAAATSRMKNTAYMDCMATLYRSSSSSSSSDDDDDGDDTQQPNMNTNKNRRVSKLSSSYLLENSIDILLGQIPLGCDEYWYYKEDVNNPTLSARHDDHVNARYVIFFRHPMDQFVSEYITRTMKEGKNDTRTVTDLIDQIRVSVTKANREGFYYEPMSSHTLITPKQMAWVERQPNMIWTPERRMNVTKMNLLQNTNQIMIGLVERMIESTSMLQYLIDPTNQSSMIFQYYTISTAMNDVQQSLHRTKSIVDMIHNDIILRSMVEEYIKYETQIYSMAVQIHNVQYRWFQQQ